jgi:hypothetical protein
MSNELKSLTLNGTKYESFVDQTARENGGGSVDGAVLYTPQTLTEEQKAQARENIDALPADTSIPDAVTDEHIESVIENYMAENPVEVTDTVSNIISLSGKYQGIDLKGFFGKIFALKANPDAKLEIPTYDNGGQPTHPKVLYFEDGWNGHKFWMAFTPWTNQDNRVENPCICYSDDGNNWSADGISNPLAYAPTEDGAIVGYNSDAHIVMVGDTMECWWRTHYQSGSRAGWLTISRRISTDGVNWTTAEELHETNDTFSNLSPVVIYEDGIYKIWLCFGFRGLDYYESADGTNWQKIREINVNLTDKTDYKIWHFDIIHSEHGYEFVGCYNPNDTTKNLYIYYATSTDNVTYTTPYMVLTVGKSGNFDSGELYRPSLVRVGNGIMLFYGARLENTRTWAIGKVEATSPEALRDILVQSGNTSAPETTTYNVTRKLTNVTTNNATNKVEKGKSYAATLSALSGYAIDSVTVTMGGADITSTAYNGNVINIASVTGDIIITATASAVSVDIPCTGITLNTNNLTFNNETAQTLTATVTPSNTTDAVTWSVSPSGIVTVVGGIVTPVSDGSCTITAKCGNYTAECTVTVSFPEAVEPTAAYLASSPGSTENAWADTKGGASMALNGGTFSDGAYQTDGVDDYAVLPLTNAKTVKLRVKNNTGISVGGGAVANAYYFDTRTAGTVYMLNYSQKDWAGATGATYYVDDTLVELGAYGAQVYMVAEQWQTITIIFNDAFTGDMKLFCSNKNVDFMAAELEYVKVYDTEVLP